MKLVNLRVNLTWLEYLQLNNLNEKDNYHTFIYITFNNENSFIIQENLPKIKNRWLKKLLWINVGITIFFVIKYYFFDKLKMLIFLVY